MKRKQTINKPFVTVVIPVFNGAPYLEETVASVQKSTYKNFEVILIDDKSKDHSKKLCHELEKKYKNVRFFALPENRGLGRVLNFALSKAKGKYICRINQDDRMLPHRIATQVAYLEKHPETVACGSSIKLFDNKGNTQIVHFAPTDKDIKNIWYVVSPFADPSVMYHKKHAIEAGGYDQSFWPADDTHLWYRLGMRGQLANLQKPVVEVRWHDGAASVRFFRTLALKTYKMHLWTHNNIKPAPLYIHAYWIIQLLAGYTLSPQLNWDIYRTLKKILFYLEVHPLREKINGLIHRISAVIPQPKRFNISGK